MSNPPPVPFTRPVMLENHLSFVEKSIKSGHMSGDGPYTKECELSLTNLLQSSPTIKLVSSATHALEIMGILSEVKPGDEVICPSFTFVSTANAFALRGAEIKFADCDKHGNISFEEIQRLYTNKTIAVVTMNYAGGSPDYEPILDFCKSKKIYLFEDAAQSIGAKYKDKYLGSFGDLACFSFHETKNINCGEGGALIVNNVELLVRAEIIREKGTNRSQFLQGFVDKYTWVDIGSSYLMPDMTAAYLLPQIQQLDLISKRRAQKWQIYKTQLQETLSQFGAEILTPAPYNSSNHHIFGLVLSRPEWRPEFIHFMKDRGISTPFHYVSLHLSPYGKSHYPSQQNLPMTTKLSESLVRLPLFDSLDDTSQERVIDAVKMFFKNKLK